MKKIIPFICLLYIIVVLAACRKTEPTVASVTMPTDIIQLKALLNTDAATNSSVLVPDGFNITGTVISNTLQEDNQTVYLQDTISNRGIRVRFGSAHNFRVGDVVQVYAAKQRLSATQNDYELSNVPLIYANRTAAGTVSPRNTNAAESATNFKDWAATLVRLKAMKKTATLNDSTFVLRDTLNGATIQTLVSKRLNYVLPDSMQFITGYLTRANSNLQIKIRTAADVIKYAVTVADTLREGFNIGGLPSYASGDQRYTGFDSGDWIFNDASVLAPNEVNDLRNGNGTVRLRGRTAGGGYIQTLFDIKGLKKIRFLFGQTKLSEGADESQPTTVETFISKNSGITWTSIGLKTGVKGSFTLAEYAVTSLPTENVRVKIVNTSFLRSTGNRLRINVDDVEFIR
ncbi:DUF5689 domain-containing protein [Mucilaginibacter terrae]|uniref:DUF5689 domain-containing protein n=1 Tax=Mucilaginibacter terrae TaxID=1955052 RepID=UPI00362A81E4